MHAAIAYLKHWLAGIHARYGVNPVIFAAIYFACVGPFYFSMYKVLSGIKKKRPGQIRNFGLVLGITIIAPFAYVALFGKNLPFWFWIVVVAFVGYSVFSIVQRIRSAKKASVSQKT